MDGRIVGGTATTIASFPWQISLQRSGSHSCGGSIYSSNIIVTAAHCLQSVSTSVLKVRVGSTYWNSGGTLVSVSSFKNHEGYNSNTMINDIAIIKLASSLSFSSSVKAISLATYSPANGASAAVSGWGTQSYGASSIPAQLQYVDLKIVSQANCASSTYGYGSEIRSTMICAYTVGKDACQGDSGGPLVSGGVLAGVVSWGYGCAYAGYPGVYADVAALRTWVLAVAGANTRNGTDGIVYPVSNWTHHPDFNTYTVDYDIAVLRLDTPLNLTHFGVRSIGIRPERPAAGRLATVAGWGYREEWGPSSYTLEQAQVPVVSSEQCNELYGAGEVNERMICAGYVTEGGTDACQGDTGGPLVIDGQLVGLVSWGRGCARPNYPSVYCYVASLVDWIEETIAA
ncbi:hypothetical protein KR018_001169, partial [Drosophila ironensis]